VATLLICQGKVDRIIAVNFTSRICDLMGRSVTARIEIRIKIGIEIAMQLFMLQCLYSDIS
jgi:hypothetical protein